MTAPVSRVSKTALLEAEPLPPLRTFWERMLRAIALVVVFTVLGLLGGRTTWWLIAMGVVFWGLWGLVVWWDQRGFMHAQGRILRVRNHLRLREVDAADVTGVRYQFNGKRPDFILDLRDGSSVWVPTSRLQRGHTTLFAWVGWFAPGATLDRRSQRFFDHLLTEKLI